MDHPLPSTHVMGKLSILVVEARDLNVSSGKEKPYILLQVSPQRLRTASYHRSNLRRIDSTIGPSE